LRPERNRHYTRPHPRKTGLKR